MIINKEAFEILKLSINKFNDWKGINAKDWGKYFYNDDLNIKLDTKITRSELLDSNFIKDLNNEEFAIAILSWGGMNREHGKSLFQNKEWLELFEKIRNNQIRTREEAYALFTALRKNKKLKGMGPAYFTKLICFVNPSLKGYIMDQWTSKSINLLFENKIISLTNSGHVADKNSSAIYEDFCFKIEFLADLLNLKPIDLEENLFSNGGFNKGKWRQFVVDNWDINGKQKTTKKVQIINDIEMEPINFEDALNQLKSDELIIPTLGGKSKLIIKVENNLIYITNSKNNQLAIDENHWNKVMNRIKELPQDERGMTSRYGVGKNTYSWKECPNQVFSIYVPAIVKYLSK
ncbi:MAG: hypothetical protein E6Q46_04985 [Flavobacterium sp.]|nr:MAG: hypothetical protein E6Q46_04985 [Flavobacterium sp.]